MRAPGFITSRQAAELLGIKPATLYTYVSRGWVARVPDPSGHGNLYARGDVLRLRARSAARSGHGPVAGGALDWGEPVIDSAITNVTAGRLYYRGAAADELARRGASYEQVAEHLWTGQLGAAGLSWPATQGPVPTRAVRGALGAGADPIRALSTAVALWRARAVAAEQQTPAHELALARQLIGWLATAPGWGRATGKREPATVAARVASALGLGGPKVVAAIDAALILIADHELNASTFAARVAASTGADLLACMGAAFAALSGPRHGAASEAVDAALDQVLATRRPADALRRRITRDGPLSGFGHPLYPAGDPRARLLLDLAYRLGQRSADVRPLRRLLDALEQGGYPAPNLDLGLVVLCRALGAPPQSASLLFGVGRLAGWTAHVLEQRQSPALLRPRARYVGRAPGGG